MRPNPITRQLAAKLWKWMGLFFLLATDLTSIFLAWYSSSLSPACFFLNHPANKLAVILVIWITIYLTGRKLNTQR